MRESQQGFTLVEMLIAVSILAMIVVLVTQLFNSAAVVTTSGNKRIDADAHSRPLFDRMSVDFAQMPTRPDIDYYFKNASNPQSGNDQLAFFSLVPGYYPASGPQSPASVVGYRINSQNQMERLGKGLVWNGVSAANAPIVFLPVTIATVWPTATNSSPDSDYELVGPQAFRFEYSYLLRNGQTSNTPWDVGAGRSSISGLQDVAAIVAIVATIDPRSRVLLSSSQISTLSSRLQDSSDGAGPGDLAATWRTTLNGITDMPRAAISAVRIYERHFYVAPK